MSWTSITIGRMTLREDFSLTSSINATTDRRTLALAGEESAPPLTVAQVQQRQEDILGLNNRLVPIRFGTKSDHDGWYVITDANTDLRNYQSGELAAFRWSLSAERLGPANSVDLESRLAGISRVNDFGLTGERWHAPAGGAFAYYTGLTQPSGGVVRATSDGTAVTVWRSVPASASPRWSVSLANYNIGRVRVTEAGIERVATNISLGASSWGISNGVVSVSSGLASSATLNVANWDGAAWDATLWNVGIGSSTVGASAWAAASVIRNDYEVATLRLIADRNPGRAMLDLTLRRGSRVVEGYLQTDSSTLLAAFLKTAQSSTATASTGYVIATANDGMGNKVLVGSARSFSGLTAQGGLAKTSTVKLDFFVGAVVAGTGAQSGDTADVLTKHYLAAMSEVTMGAVR
jgi:hypothetical protein